MKISKRIIALYEAVNKGESVADVGTDHGYVPLLLYKNGISDRVIMSDISDGSLSKAVKNAEELELDLPRDSFRVGDGIDTISEGEVDDIIIAGLGGKTIVSILDENPEKTRTFRRLILQPRNNAGELRHYLYTNGWDIDAEILSPEGKFICEVICASPNEKFTKREAPYGMEDIRWMYPEAFERAETSLLEARLDWKLGSIRDEIESLRKSSSDMTERINSLESDYNYLEKLLNKNRENNSN